METVKDFDEDQVVNVEVRHCFRCIGLFLLVGLWPQVDTLCSTNL